VNTRPSPSPAAAAEEPGAAIALWGNFGTLNLGNECTLAAALGQLRARLPAARLLCVCSEPQDVTVRHNIASIPIAAAAGGARDGARWLRALRTAWREACDWLRVLGAARGIRALLITGTGILTDHGEGTLGFPYQLFKWCLATRLHGGRVLFVSVGAESMRSPLARFWLRSALRMASYRGYRDQHSATLVERCGIAVGHDAIVPDLAFSLPPPVPAPPAAQGRPRVAVGLFNYSGRGLGGPEAAARYAAYLQHLGTLIITLCARGHAVRVIIGDLAYDVAVLEDLRAHLVSRGFAAAGAFTDQPAGSYQELIAQLETVDLVIASRFHNVLLALLLGKPVISVSYEAKNEALMQQVGLEGYCQTLDELDPQRLLGQFEQLEANAAALRIRIGAASAANRRRLDKQYERVVAEVSAR